MYNKNGKEKDSPIHTHKRQPSKQIIIDNKRISKRQLDYHKRSLDGKGKRSPLKWENSNMEEKHTIENLLNLLPQITNLSSLLDDILSEQNTPTHNNPSRTPTQSNTLTPSSSQTHHSIQNSCSIQKFKALLNILELLSLSWNIIRTYKYNYRLNYYDNIDGLVNHILRQRNIGNIFNIKTFFLSSKTPYMTLLNGTKLYIDKEFRNSAAKFQFLFLEVIGALKKIADKQEEFTKSKHKIDKVPPFLRVCVGKSKVQELEMLKEATYRFVFDTLYEPLMRMEKVIRNFEITYIAKIKELFEATREFNIQYLIKENKSVEESVTKLEYEIAKEIHKKKRIVENQIFDLEGNLLSHREKKILFQNNFSQKSSLIGKNISKQKTKQKKNNFLKKLEAEAELNESNFNNIIPSESIKPIEINNYSNQITATQQHSRNFNFGRESKEGNSTLFLGQRRRSDALPNLNRSPLQNLTSIKSLKSLIHKHSQLQSNIKTLNSDSKRIKPTQIKSTLKHSEPNLHSHPHPQNQNPKHSQISPFNPNPSQTLNSPEAHTLHTKPTTTSNAYTYANTRKTLHSSNSINRTQEQRTRALNALHTQIDTENTDNKENKENMNLDSKWEEFITPSQQYNTCTTTASKLSQNNKYQISNIEKHLYHHKKAHYKNILNQRKNIMKASRNLFDQEITNQNENENENNLNENQIENLSWSEDEVCGEVLDRNMNREIKRSVCGSVQKICCSVNALSSVNENVGCNLNFAQKNNEFILKCDDEMQELENKQRNREIFKQLSPSSIHIFKDLCKVFNLDIKKSFNISASQFR